MKKLYPLLSVLFLISFGFGQNKVNINNLVKYGDKMFEENDDKPYTGVVFDLSKSTGNKILEGRYKNGYMNGKWTYWYENGQKSDEGSFLNGDGSDLGPTGIPRNGRDGLWKFWFDNGKKENEIIYKEGKKSIVRIFDLDKSGIIMWEDVFDKGVYTNTKYFNNEGQIKPIVNVEDLDYTDYKYFEKGTNKKYSGYIKKPEGIIGIIDGIVPHGKFNLLDENNNYYTGTKFLGKYHNLITYFSNKTDSSELFFKEGKPWKGVMTECYKDGMKEKQETYEEGKVVLEEHWYQNGNKSNKKSFKDGKKNGLWTTWYMSGQIAKEERYQDGNPHGLYSFWYQNGQKKWDKNINGLTSYGFKIIEGSFTEWYKNGQKRREGTYKDQEIVGSFKLWNEDGSIREKPFSQDENEIWDSED